MHFWQFRKFDDIKSIEEAQSQNIITGWYEGTVGPYIYVIEQQSETKWKLWYGLHTEYKMQHIITDSLYKAKDKAFKIATKIMDSIHKVSVKELIKMEKDLT